MCAVTLGTVHLLSFTEFSPPNDTVGESFWISAWAVVHSDGVTGADGVGVWGSPASTYSPPYWGTARYDIMLLEVAAFYTNSNS